MNPPRALDFRNTNSLWCSILAETLVRGGVRQAVICPGSRSAPLTFGLVENGSLECIPVLDERSAGFFALGLAKQGKRPVALVCTSGTAVANFLPAVVEAHESGVPLIVLTADRPPELRDCHSGQTIDQQKIFGTYVRFAHELAVPQASLSLLRYLRQTVVHAIEASVSSGGPVHLNCPFRDPLPPTPEATAVPLTPASFGGFFDGVAEVSRSPRSAEPLRLRAGTKGLIVVGPNECRDGRSFSEAVGRIARALGWPVLADALAPVRHHAACVGNLITTYDAVLRGEPPAALRPNHVICIGAWPTSKVLRGWLQAADPQVTFTTAGERNEDALHLRTRFVRAEVEAWSRGFAGRRAPSAFAQQWVLAGRAQARRLRAALARQAGLIEPHWPSVLAAALPRGTPCFVANSMPVRDAEYFWPAGDRGFPVYFNRGANGIDGTLSTALGVAHGGRPAVLVTGDLALLHDANGFLVGPKFHGSLTVVLINNHGGGIFEHLPVAQFDPPFEEFFATPQEVDFAGLAAAHGIRHVLVRDKAHLAQLCAKLPPAGIRVLELRTHRKRDAAFRRALFAAAT